MAAEIPEDLTSLLQKCSQAVEEFVNLATDYDAFVIGFNKNPDPPPNDKQWTKLIKKIKESRTSAGNCERLLTTGLDGLSKVAADDKKRKKATGPAAHPTVGAKRFKGDSTFSIPKGRQVAARVTKDREDPEAWILAAIVSYDEHKQQYEVEDEDPGDESEPNPYRKHYFLPCHCLIPLPAETDKLKEIPKGTKVLSMFPDTTSFYVAEVVNPPKGKKNPEYTVKFEDDDDETGETPERRVKPKYVCLRENTAKS
ncbi:hypothetical protein PROFUN_14612 [Planoprotostelium fungivorum]|uniref:SGF29 C-terminal domain-containing protein n=1 Tax=Planoprotostelium fungivorum TaxID=1890364 RepID=A0A2P6MZD4_9EUKA|nr:hypothetical protein PROFUN_14612 [Planoprotostelium fungivorum]